MPLGLTPIGFDPEGGTVDWCDLRGIAPTEPFFEQTVVRALAGGARRVRTGVADLVQVAAAAETAPLAGLIFHTSRCGSTLVSRMLAQLDGALVLSEPPVVDQVLRAPLARPERAQLLSAVLGTLTRLGHRVRWVVVKLDAWATRDLELILGATPAPWVFVHRDPAAVIESQLRMPGMPGSPGLLPPELFELDLASALALGRAGYCGRVVATLLGDALAALPRGDGIAVSYDGLPDAVWSEIVPHFGLSATAGERERMAACAALDAKRPYQRFDPAAVAEPSEAAAAAALQSGARALRERLAATPAGEQRC